MLGFLALILISLVSMNFISADNCELGVSLVSQDPYPAIPGDYVKLVFQVDGIEDPSCGDLTFQLLEKYPISLDNSTSGIVTLKSGTFIKSFASHATIAYKVRIDPDALDGETSVEVAFSNNGLTTFFQSKEFNLSVEDTRADFELYVKNLDFATNQVTLEILNIAKVDVKSITLEVLDAPKLVVKGARTRIVGDLDSNEYTTTEFEITPVDVVLPVRVHYTDSAGFRRSIDKSVTLQTSLFQDRKADEKSTSMSTYIIVLVIIVGVGYWYYKKRKNAKKK